MKKTSIILAVLLVAFSAAFALQFVYHTFSRESGSKQDELKKENQSDVQNFDIVEMQPKETNSSGIENYDYSLGQNLALSLLQKCPIIIGTIQKVESKLDGKYKYVEFHVDEWLSEDRNNYENPVQLVFYTVRSAKAQDEYVLANVRFETENKLLVAQCSQSNDYRLVVSEEKYFPSIRKVIHDYYPMVRVGNLQEIPKILTEQHDLVFAGYLTEHLLRIGQGQNVNDVAGLLAELFGSVTIPKNHWSQIAAQLDYLLSGENDLLPSIREKITEKLIKMGSGRNREEAELAIGLLVSTSQKNKTDIVPFLNGENRTNLIQNYEMLVKDKFPPQERSKFEDKIRRKNP